MSIEEVINEVVDTINRLRGEVEGLYVTACLLDRSTALGFIRRIDEVQLGRECITQVLPGNVIISAKQLKLAAYLAFKAFEERRNVSRKVYIEFLLYYFGTRQIGKVLNLLNSITTDEYLLVTVCRTNIGDVVRWYSAHCECPVTDLKVVKPDLELLRRLYGVPNSVSNNDIEKYVLMRIASLVLSI